MTLSDKHECSEEPSLREMQFAVGLVTPVQPEPQVLWERRDAWLGQGCTWNGEGIPVLNPAPACSPICGAFMQECLENRNSSKGKHS